MYVLGEAKGEADDTTGDGFTTEAQRLETSLACLGSSARSPLSLARMALGGSMASLRVPPPSPSSPCLRRLLAAHATSDLSFRLDP
nr:unnamed protein product [Digitaria exilis]